MVQDERALDAAHLLGRSRTGIYYHYGVPEHELPKKVFGVFDHDVVKTPPRSRAASTIPSRRRIRAITEVLAEDIEAHPGTRDHRHLEGSRRLHRQIHRLLELLRVRPPQYDRETLKAEYDRDVARGLDVALPAHYYPEATPHACPLPPGARTRSCFYTNWLNYYVYQTTPYDIDAIGEKEEAERS